MYVNESGIVSIRNGLLIQQKVRLTPQVNVTSSLLWWTWTPLRQCSSFGALGMFDEYDLPFRSFGKHVFACKPPMMLQAYAVSGYQGY